MSMRQRPQRIKKSWAHGPERSALEDHAPTSEENKSKSIFRMLYDELPDKFECKQLVFVGYAAFIFVWMYTLCQGAWSFIGPIVMLIVDKLTTPTIVSAYIPSFI